MDKNSGELPSTGEPISQNDQAIKDRYDFSDAQLSKWQELVRMRHEDLPDDLVILLGKKALHLPKPKLGDSGRSASRQNIIAQYVKEHY